MSSWTPGCGAFSSRPGGAENTSSFRGPLPGFHCLRESGPCLLLPADPLGCHLPAPRPPGGGPAPQGVGAWWEVAWVGPLPAPRAPALGALTHSLTLCLPMMKEIFLLQGLMKLDQLVSSVTYSPFRARNRSGE